jgi:hypothetical protein
MTTMSLPIITTCTAEGCSYNHDHDCHAAAITVLGHDAACGTYVVNGHKGGVDAAGHVGACHRADCRHNTALECTADHVEIGAGQDVADCLTYAPA